MTPLYIACSNNQLTAAELCIDFGAEVGRATIEGLTPLHIACQNGSYDAARLCLDRGADVDRPDNDGQTSLFAACQEGRLRAATLCLDRGADVNRVAHFGYTPLYCPAPKSRAVLSRSTVRSRRRRGAVAPTPRRGRRQSFGDIRIQRRSDAGTRTSIRKTRSSTPRSRSR